MPDADRRNILDLGRHQPGREMDSAGGVGRIADGVRTRYIYSRLQLVPKAEMGKRRKAFHRGRASICKCKSALGSRLPEGSTRQMI